MTGITACTAIWGVSHPNDVVEFGVCFFIIANTLYFAVPTFLTFNYNVAGVGYLWSDDDYFFICLFTY